ncbi:unnamed protein product [Cochlearia groenlandica]
MDSLIKQTRRKHPSSLERSREIGNGFREKKVPARKSVSFKEDNKKSSNWLQKQFSRQMSNQSYDPISDMDHAAAIAATAYAITTFEESWLENYHSGFEHGAYMSTSKSIREDPLPLEEPRSLSRRFSGQLSFKEPETRDHKLPTVKSPMRKSKSVKKAPTFAMNLREDHTKHSEDFIDSEQLAPVRMQPPVRTRSERRAPPPPPPPPPLLLSPSPLRLPPMETKRQSSGRISRKDDSTADAWEKSELAKIQARHEKLNRKIDMWEEKKRDKSRRKLDKAEQSEIEQRRKRGLQRFREDNEYIEQIAAGARAQAEKQRHNEETKVKDKTRVIRRTGQLPGKACLCF